MDEVQLICDWCSRESLRAALADELRSDATVRLELRGSSRVFRSTTVDPAVLVAIVAGASSAMSALIGGLFRILERKRSPGAKIILRGADGTTVEAPASANPQQLKELIALASQLEKPLIRLAE